MFVKMTLKLVALSLVALLVSSTTVQAQQTSKKLPDLIVKKLDIDKSDNEVKVEVENKGEGDAGPFVVRVEVFVGIRKLTTIDKTIDKLNDGNDKNVKFDVNFVQLQTAADKVAFGAGNRRLRVVARVDANNQVAEVNENNNTLTKFVP